MSVQELEQLAPLPHFCIPRLETRAPSQKRGMYRMRRGKVSPVHLGTPQTSLRSPGLGGLAA